MTSPNDEPARVFIVDDHALFRRGVRAELEGPGARGVTVVGRMERHGGTSTIRSSPETGTEVEMHMPTKKS